MKKMMIFTALILLSLFYSHNLFACKCIDPGSIPIDETIKKSSAVFIGEVVSIESEATHLRVKFDVLASYKGIKEKSYIVVKTAKTDEACGYPFKAGERYLVFTYGDDAFYTGLCSRTGLLSDVGDTIALLPKPIFSVISETEEYRDEAKKIDAALRQIEREITKYKNESLLIKIKDIRIMVRDYTQSKSNKECKCPVIGCPPCPPCPQIIPQNPLNQINEPDFSKFFSEYKKASADKDKLRLLESLLSSGIYLNVSQTISLLKEIDFASNRKKFFTIIKGHISDPQNIYQIYNHLDFSSEKDEAKRILEGK
ncbi:MAG: DUF4476 domain-containing protein [Deltaproteobacteria bacterium]|nr:DUF4476 domain-containing protein [Deltaproteobacteria bacterium]